MEPADSAARPAAAAGTGEAGLSPHPVLDAVHGPAVILSAVRDRGEIVDFSVEAGNVEAADPAAGGAEGLVGRRLSDSHPRLVDCGLFDAYVQVLETGRPLRGCQCDGHGPCHGSVPPGGMGVRVCRLDDRLVVSWRPDGDDDVGTRLRQAQRLGNLGWSVWRIADDELTWSHQLYTIFGRDPAEGPFTAAQLAERVIPDDLPITKEFMRVLLDRREAVDAEFRIRRGDEVRRLRMMAEPVLDPAGEPTALHTVYQDVTGRRRTEQALAASREQLERQRARIENERLIAVQLQRAILPLPNRFVEKPGLRAAARYLPAGSATRVGGDWYETTAIDQGGVFLAIGDASGHGLTAAAAMARLRNALSGLAFTGAPPDRLLGWLNRVVLHWPWSLTATVIAGRYDPGTRTLTWAQAGHLPPLLLRDGTATFLDPPEGLVLGAEPEPRFETQTTRLAAGDLILLYTDGLVERRRRDLTDGLDLLLHAADGYRGFGPDGCVEHVLRELGAPNPNDDTCLVAIEIR